jgi:hypothetical protein
MVVFRIAVAVLVVCGAISPLSAQKTKKAPPPPKPPAHAATKPPAGANRPQPNPAKELDQFSKMSPEEREKSLSQLPPQRRAAFEQRLERYQRMTPEQQEHFKQQLEMMQKLPRDRQNVVRDEIQRLQALPGPERRRALNSDQFNQSYSADEQKLIRDRFPNMQNKERD